MASETGASRVAGGDVCGMIRAVSMAHTGEGAEGMMAMRQLPVGLAGRENFARERSGSVRELIAEGTE